MDRTKLKQAIEFAKQNPDSDYANELRRRIESGQIVVESKPNYLERVVGQYSDIGERTTEALKKSGQEYIEKAQKGDIVGATGSLLRSGLRSVGAVTEGAFAPITEAPIVKDAFNFIGEKIGNTELGQRLAKKIQENPETAQDIMDIVNTLTLGGGKAIEKPITVGVEKAVAGGKEALETGIKTLKTKEAIKTASQVDDLVGKITQGLEKDIPKAKKALSGIDTSNIKSYKDLSNTLNDKVSTLSTKLDDILGQNTKKIGLNDANNIIKVGEKSVKHNFIKDALTQLDDYFTKTNDITSKEYINQLKNKFSTEGVTVKDINDLARLHGEKMNSYNANGELASGLTKQAAENTRAGLKNTARDLFGDKVYKEIDGEISNVIRTRDLVDNVSKKVTQLQQKINERGFGEKVGRLVFQVADKFTGGGLKGFVQSFVPRGEGLKIMNALDLEKALNKNLKMLDKAMNSKTESATIKALEGVLNYIENPKMGLSLEDVSKNQSSDAFLKSQPTKNIINKTSISPSVSQKSLKGKGTIPENSLISEAKKYKSADEFVKAQLDKNSYVMSVNKKVYRGEGKGIGNSTLVDGQYFADSKEFASQFGDVSESVIPKGSKVFDLDKVKSGGGIIPDEMLVDNKALTKYLIDNGFDYTRNTNTRGVEFVKLNKISNELESLASKSKSLTDFKKKVMANYDKYRDELARLSKNYTNADDSRMRSPIDDIYNKLENKGIPKPKSQLEEIWKQANNK